MQPSEIRPQRAQLTAAMLGLGLLGVVMAVFPFTCVLLTLVVPLLACPLAGRKQQWAAWLAALAPAAISLLAGFHPLYAVSLALPGLCAMATALWLKRSKRLAAPAAILYEIAAYAFALLCVVICAQAALGNAIAPGLAEWLVKRVQSSGNTGLLLYRFAAAGLIAVPEGYQKAGLLSFAFDPVLIRQLLLSLRLTAERLIASALPSLFVQACMLGGLFTALRCQRLNCMVLLVEEGPARTQRKTRVIRPPGFRMLFLPPKSGWLPGVMGLASLVLLSAQSALAQTLGQLFYAAFACTFQVLGAAVIVCLLSARKPERAPLYGALAGAAYVLFPLALFFIGVADQAGHTRVKWLKQIDQNKEE